MKYEAAMIQLTDIHSLSDFQRNAKTHLKQMKKTGRPRILTINGKAELIVQDAKSYQKLLDAVERLESIEGIKRGLASLQRGEGRPIEDALEDLRKKYEIPSA
jgi:PHD/YefM family antitoxin component YafN of YafNO toxin-antitoxin module